MKPKYIDEVLPHYFVFGGDFEGRVLRNNGTEDICSLPPIEAGRIIKDRDEALGLIHVMNERYPAQFSEAFHHWKKIKE